jgi:hypothetical protein
MSAIMKIENAKVLSIEKGNVEKDVEVPVMAFSVDGGEGGHIKCLVKGDMAKVVWATLGSGETIDRTLDFKGIKSVISSCVSIEAEFREIRPRELVLQNPKCIRVSQTVTIGE